MQLGSFCGTIRSVKVLAVSDEEVERLYSLCTNGHFSDVRLILGCGDLPYPYLENLITLLNVTLFYVPGNHDPAYSSQNTLSRVEGGSNLDLKLVRHNKLLIGGFGGSIRYRPNAPNQYTQSEAYGRVTRLLPSLMWNRIRHGRALDVLISHSPPFGIHDEDTQSHQGLKAINWLIRITKPRLHLHGHVHFQRGNITESDRVVGATRIVNVFPYKVIEIND